MFKVPPHNDFYAPSDGSFGIIYKRDVDWHTCRETFLDMRRTRRFLFVTGNKLARNVCRFMDEFQDRMKLRKRDRLKIIETDKPNIVLVSLGSFWRKMVPLDLVTILLRAGRYYRRKRQFTKILNNEEYLDETKHAVKMFLNGYTELRRSVEFYGWRDTFSDMDKEEIDKALSRPKKRKRGCCANRKRK